MQVEQTPLLADGGGLIGNDAMQVILIRQVRRRMTFPDAPAHSSHRDVSLCREAVATQPSRQERYSSIAPVTAQGSCNRAPCGAAGHRLAGRQARSHRCALRVAGRVGFQRTRSGGTSLLLVDFGKEF